MLSNKITNTDVFLDMPQSSQLLYFHLCMSADDDGFVGNPKRVMRVVGSGDDDYRILIAKRYLLTFESGVCVVKHWLIHNLIRADMYKETTYMEEKKMLGLNDMGAYTEMREGVHSLRVVESPKWLQSRRNEKRTADGPKDVTYTAHRLSKDKIGKVKTGREGTPKAKPWAALEYLKKVPKMDLAEITERYEATEMQVSEKAYRLYLYCQSKGRVYKNYKALLIGSIGKDYGRKDAAEKTKFTGL